MGMRSVEQFPLRIPHLALCTRMSPASFQDAFDHAVIGMALVNPEGGWLRVNPSLCGILGYPEGELLPLSFLDLRHPDEWEGGGGTLRSLLAGEMFSYQAERRYRHRRGHLVWVLESVSLVRDAEGTPLYFIFQIEDISRRKAAEVELLAATEELQARVAQLERRTTEMALVGEMGELLQSCRTTGEAHKIIARMLPQLFPGDSGALLIMNRSREGVEAAVQWGESVTSDPYFAPDDCWSLRRSRPNVVRDPEIDLPCPHVTADLGNYLCLPLMAGRETLGVLHLAHQDALDEATLQLARTADEQIALSLANLGLQETLRNQSVRDGLTGLHNRRYLEEALERELGRAARSERPLALILIDVDHFKRFNDNFGHETGDAVLRAIAEMLGSNLRKADIACRYGGEEFVLIMPEADLENAVSKAQSLREAAKALDVRHEREEIGPITLSLGVAAFPALGSDGEALLKVADEALYRAKREGRDRVERGINSLQVAA